MLRTPLSSSRSSCSASLFILIVYFLPGGLAGLARRAARRVGARARSSRRSALEDGGGA